MSTPVDDDIRTAMSSTQQASSSSSRPPPLQHHGTHPTYPPFSTQAYGGYPLPQAPYPSPPFRQLVSQWTPSPHAFAPEPLYQPQSSQATSHAYAQAAAQQALSQAPRQAAAFHASFYGATQPPQQQTAAFLPAATYPSVPSTSASTSAQGLAYASASSYSEFPTLQITYDWDTPQLSPRLDTPLCPSPSGSSTGAISPSDLSQEHIEPDQGHIDTSLLSDFPRSASASSLSSISGISNIHIGGHADSPSHTASISTTQILSTSPGIAIQTNEAQLRASALAKSLRKLSPDTPASSTPTPPTTTSTPRKPSHRRRTQSPRKPSSTTHPPPRPNPKPRPKKPQATLEQFTKAYPHLPTTLPLFYTSLAPDLTMHDSAAPTIGSIRLPPLQKCERMKLYFHRGRRRIAQLDYFAKDCSDEWRGYIVGVRRKLVERCENYKYNRRDVLDRICGRGNWEAIEEGLVVWKEGDGPDPLGDLVEVKEEV